ncbi:MAG TPA: hypothetical protein VNJ01_14285 [Bacteriovoracaceae bacterium]|nr:hypothetical protein [Bacteriovoracaceae bacterium]
MKTLFTSAALILTIFTSIQSATACRLSPMETTRREYHAAIEYVLKSFPNPGRQINYISQLYRSSGAHVVEVVALDEAGTCEPFVLELTIQPNCQFLIVRKEGNYQCRQ